LIKKYSFGVWKPSNDGTGLLEIYNLILTIAGNFPCRKINNFYTEVHALLVVAFPFSCQEKIENIYDF